MTYPAFQAAGTPVESAAGNVSPAWPAHQAGDLGLLIVETGDWPARLVTPAGFRKVNCSPQTRYLAGRTDTAGLHVFWKIAESGAESAPTVQFNSDRIRAIIVTFRGATGNCHITWDGGWHGANGSTSFLYRNGVTVDAEQLVVMISCYGSDTATPRVSGYANASLTNLTEHHDSCSTIGGGSGFAVASGRKATAGSFGEGTSVFDTGGGNSMLASITLALTAEAKNADTNPHIVEVGEWVERTTAGDISPAWPPHQTDDIGILVVHSPDWPVATPAGWTEFSGSPQRSGTDGVSSATNLSVYWKRAASAAEAAPAVTFVGLRIAAVIFTVRNAKAAGVPASSSGSAQSGGTSSTCTFPGGTTEEPNALVVNILSTPNANRFLDPRDHTNNTLDANSIQFTFSSDPAVTNNVGCPFVITSGIRKSPGTVAGTVIGNLDASFNQGRLTLIFEQAALELPADHGTFNINGQDVALARGRAITADHGAFSYTGQDVTLSIGNFYSINAEPGIFTVQGFNLDLEKNFGRWTRQTGKDATWTKEPKET